MLTIFMKWIAAFQRNQT